MQDKTINSALLVLRARIERGDGMGLEHVEALLTMRGVPMPLLWPGRRPDAARKGAMKWLLLRALRAGPKTRAELVALVATKRPELEWVNLGDRTDKTLTKLRLDGLAARERQAGRWVWRLTPRVASSPSTRG